MASSDSWVAFDKLAHVLLCLTMTLLVYGIMVFYLRYLSKVWRVGSALLAGFAVGVMKEVGDGLQWWPGNVSTRDLVADGFGIVLALFWMLFIENCGNITSQNKYYGEVELV